MKSSSGSAAAPAAWTAESAIAGNAEALQALREIITYPLLYSRESQILGLKVCSNFTPAHSLIAFANNWVCKITMVCLYICRLFFSSGLGVCCSTVLLARGRY